VSRNDFKPPPQVESSVVRLVPLDPPPPVKFEEFDGMNRIIFSRPNKTLRANFQAKGVMKMLEENRRTWLAAQEMVGFILPYHYMLFTRDPIDVYTKMVDDVPISSLVDKVLEEAECTEGRASKMDVDDLLK
jgi:18S rRNA (adenine1779-N6/adenine1780-N6)-dimethyltransferase